MPYITTLKEAKGKEISLDQILFGEVDVTKQRKQRAYPGTVTRHYDSLPNEAQSEEDVRRLIHKLNALSFISCPLPQDMFTLYRVFEIPKRSGGMRTISAPRPSLYNNQVELRTFFETECTALYHTTAFAYCKGRSIKHCMKRHQANKSRWFLKLDFEDFFGSTNKEFVIKQLSKIYPFSEVLKKSDGKKLLNKALDICFLNDGLPQGTPISPMITNLIMIPFDHEINKILHSKGFVYTRYADDIQISHTNKFNPEEIISIINTHIHKIGYPYSIKKEKTRFGSNSGRNWNLGLMLNKDNQITIGHKRHKTLKAKLHGFAMDSKHGKRWTRQQIEQLAGEIAYFKSIEPATAKHIIEHLNSKLNVNVELLLKNDFLERIKEYV